MTDTQAGTRTGTQAGTRTQAGSGTGRRAPRPRHVVLALLVLLVVAMVLSTDFRSASAPVPGAAEEFDAAAFGGEQYAASIKPAIEEDPVELTTLVPMLLDDPEAAGEEYGNREGSSSPYTYPVTFTGTAAKAEGGLMDVEVEGLPRDVRVSVQVGPAINGTTLRDVTGTVKFNDFVNQVEYADAATALNQEMKSDLLDGLDVAALAGQEVTVVGATGPLNPEVLIVTPVSLEPAS